MKINKFIIIGALMVILAGAIAGQAFGADSGKSGVVSEDGPESMFQPQDSTIGGRAAVATAITYQGFLRDGSEPANWNYDMRFHLFDDPDAGVQLGEQIVTDVPVVDGQFTVHLDFGSAIYSTQALWLEIDITPTGEGAYQTLSPRQALTAAPLAMALPNVSTDPSTGRVSIGGGSSTSSFEVFGINREINHWVGMYITGGGPESRPFYGYATDDTGSYKYAWTEYNGGAEEWQLYTMSGNVFRVSDAGDVSADGNFSQPASAYGLVKASAYVECWDNASFATVYRSFNTVTDAAVTISPGGTVGECYIDFGFDLSTSYFSATAVQTGDIRDVTCDIDNSDPSRLSCLRWRVTGTGAEGWGGRIMVIIY